MLLTKINRPQVINQLILTRHVSSSNVSPLEWSEAKDFSKIPGPTIYEIISSGFKTKSGEPMSMLQRQKMLGKKFGNIVKFPNMLGRPQIIMLTDPVDFEKVFRTESRSAERPGFDAFVHYRKNIRKDVFKGMGGLLTEHGDKWQDMRTKVNPVMMQPRTTKKYVPGTDRVAQDFVTNLRKAITSNQPPADIFPELNKWALESIGYIAMDTRLGVLTEESNKLIDTVQEFFDLAFDLDVKPSLWKYYPTRKYKKMMSVLDELTDVVNKHIQPAIERSERLDKDANATGDNELSVLEKLLKIDRHVATIMVFDMLLAGVDTTSTASTAVLYHLAKNPEKQAILREEIMKILPDKDTPLTDASLNNAPYLKACMKEGQRLFPVLPGIIRTLEEDMILKGFKVPKGVSILLSTISLGQMDEHFPRSLEFLPERWLKNAQELGCPSSKTANPFIFLPFGFGSRSCIGKRFAELEISVLLARMIRNFEITWTGTELLHASRVVSTPSMAVKFDYKLLE